MAKRTSLFGELFSFDTFKIFSDALFASGAALKYVKRQAALQERIYALLDENRTEISPEKYAENQKQIEALFVELERHK